MKWRTPGWAARGSMLEGKGMVGRGWGGTWSQVRRSPLKHLVFVMRPWGAVVQMLVTEWQEDRQGLEARESQKLPHAGWQRRAWGL